MTKKAWPGVALLAVAFAASLASTAGAESPDTEAIARGKLTFRVYCSNCHGRSAEGDGELAKLLTVEPADLTRIRERYDGEFPVDWIARKIDGRDKVRGHGMQEMPAWGLSFRDRNRPADQEADVQAKIDELVAYLESIQKAPDHSGR